MARHEIASAEAAVDESAARVEQFRTQLRDIEANARRVVPMVDSQLLPQSEGDNMRFAAENARAALNAAIAEHDRAMRILGVRGEANVRLKQAKAIVAKAELDLENTHITAPADGIVAEINVRPGSMVERGKSLFALVEDRDWWVEANYKETDLERIRAGQSADISIDIYPGLSLKGMVESVSPASGVSFSLLPPENAVGNWVKVTQRFPVRIRIIATDAQHPLRVGASCEVSVDTQSQTPS
jgi:membrane fusion protein (multidrug efflux system)